MKLKKVISGGQTGADQASIECAYALGLEVGGTMPKGFKTEVGPAKAWALKYGLTEHPSPDYKPRTRRNVKDAEVTVWFGNIGSPGYRCTETACKDYGRPMFINPCEELMHTLAETYEVWNIAGNRASTNVNVINQVKQAFKSLGA